MCLFWVVDVSVRYLWIYRFFTGDLWAFYRDQFTSVDSVSKCYLHGTLVTKALSFYTTYLHGGTGYSYKLPGSLEHTSDHEVQIHEVVFAGDGPTPVVRVVGIIVPTPGLGDLGFGAFGIDGRGIGGQGPTRWTRL